MRATVLLLAVLPVPLVAVAPGEATQLTLSGAATTSFGWQAPAQPNGPVVRYDLLRAAAANGFASAVCVQSGLEVTNGSDAFAGSAFYLVRAVNQTGSTTGFDSQGTPIVAPGCGTCGAESCNGQDDDCSGVTDDNLTPPANNCVQTSICAGAFPVCLGATGWKCNYASINPNVELDGNGDLLVSELRCDGIDGNCNTIVDLDGFPMKGMACAAGAGICRNAGTFVCSVTQTATLCSATANPAAARDELCNGLDDTCDGQVDERTPTGGVVCFNGGAHACLGWKDAMVQVGSVWVYQYEAARPDANSGAVGADASRACSNPGVRPWVYVDRAGAAAACAAVRNSAGQPMRLCTAAEWIAACNSGTPTGNVWAYATNKTVFNATTCNGLERVLSAVTVTGASPSCYANQPGGRLYDLSGNLAEWTSTPVLSAGTTFYKVAGGAYTTPSLGTSCNHDDFMLPAATPLPDVGFRCCSDVAP